MKSGTDFGPRMDRCQGPTRPSGPSHLHNDRLASLDPRPRQGVACLRRSLERWRASVTPTEVDLSEVAPVDPTEARNDILGCFGRSHRRAQRHPWLLQFDPTG